MANSKKELSASEKQTRKKKNSLKNLLEKYELNKNDVYMLNLKLTPIKMAQLYAICDEKRMDLKHLVDDMVHSYIKSSSSLIK